MIDEHDDSMMTQWMECGYIFANEIGHRIAGDLELD